MNKDAYEIPAAELECEITVLNSRFIASLAPAFSVEEARDFHKRTKQRFADASHHVPAFVIGHGNSVITHCSDDGEPSGTAGRPALAVLQGSGLGDVVVVVTRYFGGTKLGTGGLVKAYGDAVREALQHVRRAVKIATVTFTVDMPYPLYEQAVRMVAAAGAELLEGTFTTSVLMRVCMREADLPAFTEQLSNLTAGAVMPVIVDRNPETIFPLDK